MSSDALADKNDRIDVRVTAIRYAGPAVNLYELRPLDGDPLLPPFEAGAHIDVHLSNGLVRQYSLAGDVCDRSRYVLGVKRDDQSRGGSSHIHDVLRVGQILPIGMPRNNFALVEEGRKAIFIAGGIGVTPFLSMARRAEAIGIDWILHAAVRTRESAEILIDLQAYRDRIRLHVDADCGNKPLEIGPIVASAEPETHLYCCGPAMMLESFEKECALRPQRLTHVERFAGDVQPAIDGGFVVQLSRSKRTVYVRPGQSIADAIREVGVTVETSCGQGICGTCETRVLGGIPDHRDVILSEDEKVTNTTMMICCSGSKTDALVLDL
jgi:tetrachlorobenzoquinone reductase